MTVYDKARAYIYRCARPIDLALFKYYFENGSGEDVITALSAYQNPDGGFGNALEADNFNPNSLPLGVWKATEYIREVGGISPSHPIIKGILRYLDSGDGFNAEHNQWMNTVPSSNDYPCAVWWKYSDGGSDYRYNPTAALAGFIIRYAEKGSDIYNKGVQLAAEAAEWFIAEAPVEQHIARCFITMYEDCKAADNMPFDADALLSTIDEVVDKSICRDPARWYEYLPRPSAFISSRSSRFYNDGLEEACRAECDFLKAKQDPDGSYYVPWTWGNDYKEWNVAEVWCRAYATINNMRFLKAFDGLE